MSEILFWGILFWLNMKIGGYFLPTIEQPKPILTGEWAQYSCYSQKMNEDGDNFVNAAMFLSQSD
tara:strand:- start:536 stop:730 length:195 start_codon:yes stop_codon:yes gene_type:complete